MRFGVATLNLSPAESLSLAALFGYRKDRRRQRAATYLSRIEVSSSNDSWPASSLHLQPPTLTHMPCTTPHRGGLIRRYDTISRARARGAWCLADCGSDAHDHVRKCPSNARPGEVYGKVDLFEAHHRQRRRNAVQQYLLSLPPDDAEKVRREQSHLCERLF